MDEHTIFKCLKCGNEEVVKDADIPLPKHKQSLFDRIIASPEVLAEEFVEPYTTWAADGNLNKMWQTSFRDLSCRLFDTKEEAIAATVARLKEVCNE